MTSEPQRTTSGMTSLRRLRVAAVLTVAGLAISLFWLIRRFFAHPPPGTGAQTQYVFFFLASAAVATLASGAAVGLAVPILVREPALRTPTRIAFSLAAALTALLVLTFWASMFLRVPGSFGFVFFALAPGVPVLLVVSAVQRFRAESLRRWPIVALTIGLFILWAIASYVALAAIYVVLSTEPRTQNRVTYLATLTYAVFGSGLVLIMRRPGTRVARVLLIVGGVVMLLMVLFWVAA